MAQGDDGTAAGGSPQETARLLWKFDEPLRAPALPNRQPPHHYLKLWEVLDDIGAAGLSDDGSVVLTLTGNAVVALDAATGGEVHRFDGAISVVPSFRWVHLAVIHTDRVDVVRMVDWHVVGTISGTNGFKHLAWSPDASRLAVFAAEKLGWFDVVTESEGSWVVDDPAARTYLRQCSFPSVSWFPDSRRVAVLGYREFPQLTSPEPTGHDEVVVVFAVVDVDDEQSRTIEIFGRGPERKTEHHVDDIPCNFGDYCSLDRLELDTRGTLWIGTDRRWKQYSDKTLACRPDGGEFRSVSAPDGTAWDTTSDVWTAGSNVVARGAAIGRPDERAVIVDIHTPIEQLEAVSADHCQAFVSLRGHGDLHIKCWASTYATRPLPGADNEFSTPIPRWALVDLDERSAWYCASPGNAYRSWGNGHFTQTPRFSPDGRYLYFIDAGLIIVRTADFTQIQLPDHIPGANPGDQLPDLSLGLGPAGNPPPGSVHVVGLFDGAPAASASIGANMLFVHTHAGELVAYQLPISSD